MKIINIKISLLFLVIYCLLASCVITKQASLKDKETTISSIKFLDDYVMPLNQTFNNTVIGGLSGIDYNVKQINII